MTLAISDQDGVVSQRSVVLRSVERDDAIVFYTDQRSHKLRVIGQNDQVSVLFYDPKIKVQVSCQGAAQVENLEVTDLSNYKLRSTKDYTTILSPGTSIEDPGDVSFDSDNVHFAQVRVVLSEISYLKLGSELHVRASFTKINGDWMGQYIVP